MIDRAGTYRTIVCTLVVPLSVFQMGVPGAVADEVTWMDSQGDIRVRTGEVESYTFDELRFRLPQGTERRIPYDRVRDVVATRTEDHREADDHFAQHEFDVALTLYRKAYRDEQRMWVKQQIAAQSIVCLQNLGQATQAATTFVALVTEDPLTPFVDAVPLAWQAEQPDRRLEAFARDWINGSQPAARLIAASWLLSGPKRAEALTTLDELSRSRSLSWIGPTARAQSWRTQLVQVRREEIRRWQTWVEQIPVTLRAGPYFLLGEAYSRHAELDAAVLAYLQVGLMYPRHRELGAQSLWSAARLLQQANRVDEAERIQRELTQRYPDHPLAIRSESSNP